MEPAGKAHVFVGDLDALELADDDRHHLARVLRLRPGDELTASDGIGRWRRCRFGTPLEPIGAVESDAAPRPELTVAFALVKGERPELVVQKLTEIGIDRIVPFVADRSVVQWDEGKAGRNHTRLTVVAREAAMQSRRSWLPAVEPLASFDDLAIRAGVALTERNGRSPTLAHPVLLVGPEGGWSERERAAGLPAVGLGPTVLRSETAAIVAGAALSGLRTSLSEGIDRHGG